MNRLLILLFGVVSTLAVSILLILLYRYANRNDEVPEIQRLEPRTFTGEKANREETKKWMKSLASREKPSFSYAVSETEVSLPLKKRPEPRTSFRLILRNLDDYKMFCIKQLFERNGIDFAVFKRGGEAVVVVHDIDGAKRERIINMVREYDVKTEIEKYVKD